MSHRLASSILAILFLFLIRISGGIFRYMLLAMIGYLVVLLAYNVWYLKRIGNYNLWVWIRPVISLGAMLSIFFIMPDGFLKGVFLIFATCFLYFSELTISASAEQVVFIDTLVSYFGLCLGFFGENFYFPSRNYLVLLGFGVLTYLISRTSLDYIPQPQNKKNFYSIILALCVIELAWAMLFLPLHFTALALFLFNCFYVLWIITYYYLFNNLTRKKITFHAVFACFIIFVTLITTPWK